MRTTSTTVLLVLALLLAACGGGDDPLEDGGQGTTEAPTQAVAEATDPPPAPPTPTPEPTPTPPTPTPDPTPTPTPDPTPSVPAAVDGVTGQVSATCQALLGVDVARQAMADVGPTVPVIADSLLETLATEVEGLADAAAADPLITLAPDSPLEVLPGHISVIRDFLATDPDNPTLLEESPPEVLEAISAADQLSGELTQTTFAEHCTGWEGGDQQAFCDQVIVLDGLRLEQPGSAAEFEAAFVELIDRSAAAIPDAPDVEAARVLEQFTQYAGHLDRAFGAHGYDPAAIDQVDPLAEGFNRALPDAADRGLPDTVERLCDA